MTEDETFAELRKWTYDSAIEYVTSKWPGRPHPRTWSEYKAEIKRVTGWDTDELYKLRKEEIERKGLFR